VHKKCTELFNEIYATGKECAAWKTQSVFCFRAEAEQSSCDAPIMKRLIRAGEEIAAKAIPEVYRENPEGCDFKVSKEQ